MFVECVGASDVDVGCKAHETNPTYGDWWVRLRSRGLTSDSPQSHSAMTPLPKAPCEHSPNTSSDCLTHTLQEALAQGQYALVLSLLNRLRLQLSTPSGTRPNASNAASVAACVLRSSPAPNPQVGSTVKHCQE